MVGCRSGFRGTAAGAQRLAARRQGSGGAEPGSSIHLPLAPQGPEFCPLLQLAHPLPNGIRWLSVGFLSHPKEQENTNDFLINKPPA